MGELNKRPFIPFPFFLPVGGISDPDSEPHWTVTFSEQYLPRVLGAVKALARPETYEQDGGEYNGADAGNLLLYLLMNGRHTERNLDWQLQRYNNSYSPGNDSELHYTTEAQNGNVLRETMTFCGIGPGNDQYNAEFRCMDTSGINGGVNITVPPFPFAFHFPAVLQPSQLTVTVEDALGNRQSVTDSGFGVFSGAFTLTNFSRIIISPVNRLANLASGFYLRATYSGAQLYPHV